MKKLLIVASFAAFAAYPAAACDWNREASASGTDCCRRRDARRSKRPRLRRKLHAPATSVAADESARKANDEPVPIVLLITDRH